MESYLGRKYIQRSVIQFNRVSLFGRGRLLMTKASLNLDIHVGYRKFIAFAEICAV